MTDAAGNVVKWCGIDIDIDDRKRAEQELHKTQTSERNLDTIINAIPALAWSALPNGLAEFFNQHFLDYAGITQEQARGSGWASAVHPEDLPELLTRWQQIMASEKLGEAEARLRRFDGEYRWFLFRASPLRDELGRIVLWCGVNTDIDDRKRAAEELRQNEALLAEGQRLSLTGSFSCFLDSNEWTLSAQARRIFGLRPDECVTLAQIESRIHPEDLPLLSAKVEALQRGVAEHDHEFRLRMPDGAVKHLRSNAYVTPLRVGRRELIGAIQDVTEWRLSEQALGKVRSELAHVTRLASLGALTASIAHEVNQPLSGIVTNANTCLRILAAENPNLDGARETARRTIRDANRAAEVITRLRAMFSKKGVATESLDLNQATREVLALSASELERACVVLRLDLEQELPLVVGDRVQLQQVILNLLLNALAAMSSVDDRPRQVLIRTESEQGQHVRLTVRDAGVGLDSQTVEQLFEPFYTTKTLGTWASGCRSVGRSWRVTVAGCGPSPTTDPERLFHSPFRTRRCSGRTLARRLHWRRGAVTGPLHVARNS